MVIEMERVYIEEPSGGLYVAGKRISLDSIVYAFNRGASLKAFAVFSAADARRNLRRGDLLLGA
jgi:hypothetical protein